MFFTINFNTKLVKNLAQTVISLIVLFECFLLRKDFNVLKITKRLIVLFIFSCVVSLFFLFPGSKITVIHVDSLGIGRYSGLMGHTNIIAVLALILMAILLQLYLKKKISNLWFLIYCSPMALIGICTKGKLFLILSGIIALIYFVFLFQLY